METEHVRNILETGVITYPGSVDKYRNPLIFIRLELSRYLETASSFQCRDLLNALVDLSKQEVRSTGFAVLIDATKGQASSLAEVLDLIGDYFPAPVNKVYIVQNAVDEGLLGRAYGRFKAMVSSLQGSTNFPSQTVNGYKELSRFIDANQLPKAFSGNFDFNHLLWLETRIEISTFVQEKTHVCDMISSAQERLIKAIPDALPELLEFEEATLPMLETIYIPARNLAEQAEKLLLEASLSKSDSDSSRFRYCPLSVIHRVDIKRLKSFHEKLLETSENFLNLWGLQIQKTYLEKFTLCHSLLKERLVKLESEVTQKLNLDLVNLDSHYQFYTEIQLTLASDDKRLYECVVSAQTSLRDWTQTQSLPTDDLVKQVEELTVGWVRINNIVNDRKRELAVFKDLPATLDHLNQSCAEFLDSISTISVSESYDENVQLPVKHESCTQELTKLNNTINDLLGDIDTTRDVILGNINIESINQHVINLLEKKSKLCEQNNQCLAIKEQISLFFSCVKDIKDWLENVGTPFIQTQNLGSNLEESKEGKRKFLKFLSTSGLDQAKQKLSQASKTLSVVLNSQFLTDSSVNTIQNIFTETEQDWKLYGIEAQEHSRDIELSIEFYEAAESVNYWLNKESDTVNGYSDDADNFHQLKKDMKEKSDVMDICHRKYVELSASSNSTLRYIRTAKTRIDDDWKKMSERIIQTEKEMEQVMKSQKLDNESRSSSSSINSLDLHSDQTAFRNTKMLIQELVNTERSYVEDLKCVVEGYKLKIQSSNECPDNIKHNTSLIFGNIEEIYNFHGKIFLYDLERSEENYNVGDVFCSNIENFNLYTTYCKNKPHSENFLSSICDNDFLRSCQRELNHVLDLSSYLLKPVQRIMKYNLILEKLLKYSNPRDTSNREKLQNALNIMEGVPRYVNDVIHLMGLEGYTGDIDSLGHLLLQDNFTVFINGQRRPTTRQIFIFKHAIIFSKPTPKAGQKHQTSRKTSSIPQPKYQFKNEVSLEHVGLTTFLSDDDKNVKFKIEVYKKGQKGVVEFYIVEAGTPTIKQTWVDKITALLVDQFEQLKNRAASSVL